MLPPVAVNYKSLMCPNVLSKFGSYITQLFPKWKRFKSLYYLNDSIFLNDRIVHPSIQGSTNSRITAEYRTAQKTKVGITPIPGRNSNFSCDIKRRTWFDFVSNQVLFLVAEAGLEPATSGLWAHETHSENAMRAKKKRLFRTKHADQMPTDSLVGGKTKVSRLRRWPQIPKSLWGIQPGAGFVSGSFGRPTGKTRITEATTLSQKSQNPGFFSEKAIREEIGLKSVRKYPDNRCIARRSMR